MTDQTPDTPIEGTATEATATDGPGHRPATTVETGSRMSRLFDLRYVIGALMGVYGAVLLVRGLLDGTAERTRAAGLAINLWTGIALLVVAALFLGWARWRPLGIEVTEDLGAPARRDEEPTG